ncbi:MAG: mandelate racemase/muconate lactonizing enzyme family protein, partial [Candidatus Aminicenantales bacterium]
PRLIGQDPSDLSTINQIMDHALGGHAYIKSPLDIACWDILGQALDVPVATLLGGRCVERFPLYRAISQGSADKMAEDVARYRKEGYRKFQLKVGGKPEEDILRVKAVRKVLQPDDVLVADANTGWLSHQALRVVLGLEGEDVFIEQPCRTLEECLVVRERTRVPMVLDEVIRDVPSLIHAYEHRAMDVVNLKISRLGGLTKARLLRDLCQSLGIAMTIEDSWGGDITTATIAHLAGSTPPEFYFSSTDFNSYNDTHIVKNPPEREEGSLSVPDGPGLGVEVEEGRLGEPVVTIK